MAASPSSPEAVDPADPVDAILAQWEREKPGLDVSPMAVMGRLARAAAAAEARLAETFAANGIDAATFDVLATLRRTGAPYRLSPAALARAAMISTSAVAQRLNRLERDGLVTRTADPGDGRARQVTLTDSGLRIIDGALPEHVATEERILSGLNAAERASLAGLLARVAAGAAEAAGPAVPPA